MHKALTFKVNSINGDSACHNCLVIMTEVQHRNHKWLTIPHDIWVWSPAGIKFVLYNQHWMPVNNESQRKSKMKTVKPHSSSLFFIFECVQSECNHRLYYYSLQDQCSLQSCKSRLQALSVLTVCCKTLVLQNPTLMAYYMRPYICSVLKSLSRVCVWSFPCVFITQF